MIQINDFLMFGQYVSVRHLKESYQLGKSQCRKQSSIF
jgi:hypothetical protein